MALEPILRLERITDGPSGPLGRLYVVGTDWSWLTLEDDEVPAGTYRIERYDSPRFGRELFRLVGVPDRSAIAIHGGNTREDTEGCILLGQRLTAVGQVIGLMHSQDALGEFMDVMEGHNRATLIIRSQP